MKLFSVDAVHTQYNLCVNGYYNLLVIACSYNNNFIIT